MLHSSASPSRVAKALLRCSSILDFRIFTEGGNPPLEGYGLAKLRSSSPFGGIATFACCAGLEGGKRRKK